jgi:hypothetical protein
MELLIGIMIGLGLGITIALLNKTSNPIVKKANGLQSSSVQEPPAQETLFQSLRHSQEATDEIKAKLIAMVNGDRDKAEALVAKARFANYGHSENYYWWKAIRDLEAKNVDVKK